MIVVSIDDKPRDPMMDEMALLAYESGFTASYSSWAMQPKPHGEAGVRNPETGNGIVVSGPNPATAVSFMIRLLTSLQGK